MSKTEREREREREQKRGRYYKKKEKGNTGEVCVLSGITKLCVFFDGGKRMQLLLTRPTTDDDNDPLSPTQVISIAIPCLQRMICACCEGNPNRK